MTPTNSIPISVGSSDDSVMSDRSLCTNRDLNSNPLKLNHDSTHLPALDSPYSSSNIQVQHDLCQSYAQDDMSTEIPYLELKKLFSHDPLLDLSSPSSYPKVR